MDLIQIFNMFKKYAPGIDTEVINKKLPNEAQQVSQLFAARAYSCKTFDCTSKIVKIESRFFMS